MVDKGRVRKHEEVREGFAPLVPVRRECGAISRGRSASPPPSPQQAVQDERALAAWVGGPVGPPCTAASNRIDACSRIDCA